MRGATLQLSECQGQHWPVWAVRILCEWSTACPHLSCKGRILAGRHRGERRVRAQNTHGQTGEGQGEQKRLRWEWQREGGGSRSGDIQVKLTPLFSATAFDSGRKKEILPWMVQSACRCNPSRLTESKCFVLLLFFFLLNITWLKTVYSLHAQGHLPHAWISWFCVTSIADFVTTLLFCFVPASVKSIFLRLPVSLSVVIYIYIVHPVFLFWFIGNSKGCNSIPNPIALVLPAQMGIQMCRLGIHDVCAKHWTGTSFQTISRSHSGGLSLTAAYLIMEMLTRLWENAARPAKHSAETSCFPSSRLNASRSSCCFGGGWLKTPKCDDLSFELSHSAQTNGQRVWRGCRHDALLEFG